MFAFQDIYKSWGDTTILDNVSLSLAPTEKAGLIGTNGAGKSTLLKIIAGKEEGSIRLDLPKNTSIHYLPQDPAFEKETVKEEMAAFANTLKEKPEPYRIDTVLTKLDLPDQPIDILSGGQKKRLALAKALLSDADILLLDEPTNHLDTDMIDWLEKQLAKSKQTILMITHDRYFLDCICTRIFELDHAKLYTHNGSFETYLKNKAEREARQTKTRNDLNRLYKKELAWVQAGVQARGTKSKSRLDAFEKLKENRKQKREQTLQILAVSQRLGKKTGEFHNVSFAWQDQKPLFQDFSYLMKKEERLGIVGPNGCGKTTLLKVLAQKLQPTSGTISWGPTVKIGWYGQTEAEMAEDLHMRVRDYIEETASLVVWNGKSLTASQMLERFLIDKDRQYLPLERLSGGERKRVYLLKVLMEAPNVLFLDEPTNDLDLLTLELLEDYLDSFAGLIITVSHDRYFMDRVCESIFAFEDGRLHQYMGGFQSWSAQRQENRRKTNKEQKEKAKGSDSPKPKNPGRLTYHEKRELETLSQQLEQLEQTVNELNAAIGSCLDYQTMAAMTARRDEACQQMEEKTMRWLELEEKKEQA